MLACTFSEPESVLQVPHNGLELKVSTRHGAMPANALSVDVYAYSVSVYRWALSIEYVYRCQYTCRIDIEVG